MASNRRGNGEVQKWELDLIVAVARRLRTPDAEELRAVLNAKLLTLKSQTAGLPLVRARAFTWVCLRNAALNWVRRPPTEFVPIDQDGPDPRTENDPLIQSLAIRRLLRDVSPNHLKVLEALWAEGGSRHRASQRLQCHRNTVGSAVRAIRQVARRHGL
jgi:DNA-directed RNA polymerase specialized sigma24 family protein